MMTKPHAKSIFAVVFICLLVLAALAGIPHGGSESISSYEKQAISVAYFSWQHTGVDTITFTAYGPDSATYTWSFDDGATGQGKTVTHTFQPGTYTVTLTTDRDGDTTARAETLTISGDPPIADFTWQPETPTTQDDVQFWDTSIYPENDDGPWNWTWDFDDGHVGYGPAVNHTFTDNGLHNVTLTLRHENDTYPPDSVTKQLFVFNVPPTALFYWTRDNGVIHFDATASKDTDGAIVNYTWDFDDGNSSYLQNPDHVYAENDTYTVTLTVRDDDGETATVTRDVDTTNYLPDAMAYIDPVEATIRTDVVFNDTSVDMDGTIVNRTWNLGDGTTSHAPNMTHRYSAKGTYTVTLTVIDNDYAYNTTTRQVDVINLPPDVFMSWDPVYPAVNENVTFFNYSVGPGDIRKNTTDLDGYIANQTWIVDNQTVGYGPNYTHSFSTNGIHTVTLRVTDDSDDTNRSTRQVHVADIYVDDDQSPAWYDHTHVRTVQEGVDNATAGDLIHVLAGTYREQAVVDKTVTVVGKDATVDGTGGTAFTVTADNVMLHELHVINTSQAAVVMADNVTVTGCHLDTSAGGILVKGLYTHISSNTFQGQGTGTGAAVRIEGSHTYTAYNAFTQTPDGVAIVDGVNHTIEANSFRDAIRAVQVKNAQDCYIMNNTFTDNHYGVEVSTQGCLIAGNVLRDNDKAILLHTAATMVYNNTLTGNVIGVEVTGAGNTVVLNTIRNSQEAAVNLTSSSNTQISDCTLTGNVIGVAAYGSGTPLAATIDNVTFSNTTDASIALHSAAAFVSGCTFSDVFRGVYVTQSSDVTVQSCIFQGGATGIYIQDAAPSIAGCEISGYDTGVMSRGQQAAITGSTVHNNTVGLRLEGENTSITDCLIRDNGYGVSAHGARNLTVEAAVRRNTCGMSIEGGGNILMHNTLWANNTDAVSLDGTSQVSIHQCSIVDSTTGLELDDAEHCEIRDTHLSRNDLAVSVLTSSHNTFDGNNLTDNTVAFLLSRAPSNVLLNNSFTDNTYALDLEGNTVSHYHQDIDTSNTVNGQPVHYTTNQSDVVMGSQYGYLAFVSCDNVTVTGAVTEPNGEGLLLVDVHTFTVQQGAFTHSMDGAVLLASSHGTIAATTCSDNTDDGVSMTGDTHNISITGCTVTGNGQRGVNLYRSTGGAGHVSLSDSRVIDNWLGVNIENTRSNIIENLTFSGNQNLAVRLYKSDDIYLGNVTLHDNTDGMDVIRSTVTLHNGTIHHHDTAVTLTDGTAVVRGTILRDNDVGIAATRGTLRLTDTAVRNHSIGVTADNATVAAATTSFKNNTRALHAVFSTLTVDRCPVSGNTYGLLLDHADGARIGNCTGDAAIADNIYAVTVNDSTDAAVINCSLYGNEHAVRVTDSMRTVIDDCLAYNNTDAVVVDSANGTAISSSLLHHNVHALDIHANNTTAMRCSFWKNMYGVRILAGRANSIYHNNFAYNMEQASDAGVNTSWDNGYPAGGNYWSNYAGTDHRKGPGQNESGSDGIGDIPFPIAGGAAAADIYPLMELVDQAATIPNSPPEAIFFIYPSQPLSGETVDFVDQSTDPNGNSDIVAWQWDFGDGNTSTSQHPSHMYDRPGNYTVTLTVTDSQDVSSSHEMNITVANTPPIADFTMSPQQPAVGQTVQFTDGSTDGNGAIVSWNWTFGDGSVSSQQHPSHQYSTADTYTVTLTVTDDNGATDTATATVTVAGTTPTAAFSVTPAVPKTGDVVAFTDLSTDDGTIVTWHWDYGDGNASAAQDPTHTYEEAGTYTVTLTVWDDDGAKNTTTKSVTIEGDNDTPGFMFPLVLLAIAAVCIAVFRRRGKV